MGPRVFEYSGSGVTISRAMAWSSRYLLFVHEDFGIDEWERVYDMMCDVRYN